MNGQIANIVGLEYSNMNKQSISMNHISRKELLDQEYNKVMDQKLPNILHLLNKNKVLPPTAVPKKPLRVS